MTCLDDATVLSLVVVPSFFLIMDDLSQLLTRILGRLVARRDGDGQPFDHERRVTLAVGQNRGSEESRNASGS